MIKVKIPFATSGLVLTRNTHFKEIISVNSRFRSNNSSNTSPRRDPRRKYVDLNITLAYFGLNEIPKAGQV